MTHKEEGRVRGFMGSYPQRVWLCTPAEKIFALLHLVMSEKFLVFPSPPGRQGDQLSLALNLFLSLFFLEKEGNSGVHFVYLCVCQREKKSEREREK